MLREAIFFTACIIVATAALPGQAGAAELSRKLRTLTGLQEVEVVVESLGEDARKAGLSEERIKAAAEGFLTRNGIKVVSGVPPYVYIQCVAAKSPYSKEEMVYSLNISVRQPVTLIRNPQTQLFGVTWERTGLGITGPGESFADIEEAQILNLLALLVKDYKVANAQVAGQ